MNIDRQTAKEISDKVKSFINSLEDEYGIVAEKASSRYSDTSVKLTINCVVSPDKRDDGLLTREEERYDIEAKLQNLPARGTIFTTGYGEKFEIKEWLIRGRKYQVLGVKVSDGKRYKFSVQQILQHV